MGQGVIAQTMPEREIVRSREREPSREEKRESRQKGGEWGLLEILRMLTVSTDSKCSFHPHQRLTEKQRV